jgi:hypothetical protein
VAEWLSRWPRDLITKGLNSVDKIASGPLGSQGFESLPRRQASIRVFASRNLHFDCRLALLEQIDPLPMRYQRFVLIVTNAFVGLFSLGMLAIFVPILCMTRCAACLASVLVAYSPFNSIQGRLSSIFTITQYIDFTGRRHVENEFQ